VALVPPVLEEPPVVLEEPPLVDEPPVEEEEPPVAPASSSVLAVPSSSLQALRRVTPAARVVISKVVLRSFMRLFLE
jgi:hypothetical protein